MKTVKLCSIVWKPNIAPCFSRLRLNAALLQPPSGNRYRNLRRFIAQDNPARAVTYIKELRTKCRSLLNFPEAYPIRAAYGDGVRMAVFGRYLILYVAMKTFWKSAV